jgi:hypothetical protein
LTGQGERLKTFKKSKSILSIKQFSIMKKIKIILPALAILFAVVASFGTSASTNLVEFDVTTDMIAPCDAIGKCVVATSGPSCETDANLELVRQSNCTTNVSELGDYIAY